MRKSAAEALLFRANAETGERLQIRILGPFQLQRRDGPVTEEQWRMKKAKGLLAYLVTGRDRQISEETLMDLFWPNLTPDRARHNLHNTVYSLRRVLEPELREGSVSRFIVHRKSFYRFNPESPYWLDTEEFEKHGACADRLFLQGKRAEAILEYQEAERLYRGDFLEDDLDAEWAGVARDQLRGKYLDILWRLADYFSEQKKHEVSKNLCRKILQADDCYEKAYLILMKNFWLEGRKDEAVKHYHICADTLKRELGVSVSEEVMALYLQIIG
ncbi:MAG: hypothetical protein HYU64_08680 [Armatimonadetes bacterium]|nr:hypothetical protein [Armatimonadota bacterium]